jgi:aminoglycoside phosphotransferase (APT) family kinase protein
VTGEDYRLGEQLMAFLSAQLNGAESIIVDLRRIGIGRSRENWVFDLISHRDDGSEEREALILRRDPEGGLVETDRATEFAVLRSLERSSLQVPRARWLDAQGTWLGRPSLIMNREVGEAEYRVLNGNRPPAERKALAEQFCDLLGQVHRVDWRQLGLADVFPDPGQRAASVELGRWERILRRDQLEAYPELELAISWLREFAPSSRRTVLVHADFKPGNILLDGRRVTALLDWELAHLGDPAEDLGWVTQPLRAREHLITGEWARRDLLEHYSRVTGFELDDANIDWWATFATFKTAVMQVSGLRSFVEGRSFQPYRPSRKVLGTLLRAIDDGSRYAPHN